MKDIQQLIKKNSQEGRYEDIFPKTFIDAVKDKESGKSLIDILSSFNMYFLSYNGSREQTRLQVPLSLRKTGLWITYVLYDKTVVTEWYAGEAIDDNSWKNLSNWRVGSNMLVGDISISSDGYWVINGVVTTTKAQGEQGITPMLRVGSNNHLQVSYTNGSSWVDVSTNPVYTQFRVSNNKLQQSTDLGESWSNISEELAYQFRNSGNKLQVSKDLGITWEDTSDYIAAWFRFTGTSESSQADNVGKIQISRDNGVTWSDLSGEFTNSLHIKGYVATVGALPSSAVQGDIYGVGPTYDPSDTEQTNPIYQLYVKDSTGWVNNGKFTSIAAGVVQTTGTSTTEVMSQDAVSKEFASVRSDLNEIEQEQIQGGVYDVSSHNDGAVFESLSTLLGSANLSTLIPTSVRHGGMSIRFVQSSDNKYVKFFCTADEFTTDVTQWQGVDDEPIDGSDNLIKSGVVFGELHQLEPVGTDVAGSFIEIQGIIMRANTQLFESAGTSYRVYYYAVQKGSKYTITADNLAVNSTWTTIGFSDSVPAKGGSLTNIYVSETTGGINFTTSYMAEKEGYLCIAFQNTGTLSQRVQVIQQNQVSKFDLLQSEVDGANSNANNRVSYNESQTLTSTEKQTARTNIDAASVTDLGIVISNVDSNRKHSLATDATVIGLSDVVYTNAQPLVEIIQGIGVFQGVANKSTLKFSASSTESYKTLYIPVTVGNLYKVIASNLYCYTTWVVLGFTETIPSTNVEVVSLKEHTNNVVSLNDVFVPVKNGYLCVTGTNTEGRIHFYSAVRKLMTDELEDSIDNINDEISDIQEEINITYEEEQQLQVSSYVSSLIMRQTNQLFEAAVLASNRVVYVPVSAGKRYVVHGTDVYLGGATWSMLGFSTSIPQATNSYVDILHYDSTGNKTFVQEYTPSANGYICVNFDMNIDILSEKVQVYEYSTVSTPAIQLLVKGEVSQVSDAKIALLQAPQSFNIGLTNLRATKSELTNLTISNSGNNYNDCIKQYLNSQDERHTSKLISIEHYDLDPHIGDFSTINDTFWREVIGVDSEGWVYCAQRSYGAVFNSSLPANLNIYIKQRILIRLKCLNPIV